MVEVMMGVRERGVRGLLVVPYLGAGLEAAMATQAGKHRQVRQGTRGNPGGGGGIRDPVWTLSTFVSLLPPWSAGCHRLQLGCGGAAAWLIIW